MEPTKLHVVFDIDDTLTTHYLGAKTHRPFYTEYSAIIKAEKRHYLLPGAIELIQLLFKEKISFSFFSAGSKERGELFVPQLIKLSLGEEKGNEALKNIKILSREDLVPNTQEKSKTQYKTYGLHWANNKKDLKKLSSEIIDLSSTILIDDNYSYIEAGQEKSFLCSRYPQYEAINNCYSIANYYLSYSKIPLYFQPEVLLEGDLEGIEEGTAIYLLQKENSFEIHYYSKKTNCSEVLTIDEENQEELFPTLQGHFAVNNNSNDFSELTEEMKEKIYLFIDSSKGLTDNIYHSINPICYLAGMLFLAMEEAAQKNQPITEVLFQKQFKETANGCYKQIFPKVTSQVKYYLYGLQKLKEINENFSFITPTNFNDSLLY